jgi:hypothetical protein
MASSKKRAGSVEEPGHVRKYQRGDDEEDAPDVVPTARGDSSLHAQTAGGSVQATTTPATSSITTVPIQGEHIDDDVPVAATAGSRTMSVAKMDLVPKVRTGLLDLYKDLKLQT